MLNSELLGTLFGLAAAASWGAGDFSGGLTARRSHAYMVAIVLGIVGLFLLIGLALLLGELLSSLPDLAWGGTAGIAGTIGLVALYHGLAIGRMGVVAPVTAVVTAAAPLFLGLFLEGIPAGQKLLGFGLALVAVWLLFQTGDGTGIQVRGLRLPLVAGLGFGFFLVVIGRVSQTAVLWPLAAARLAATSVLLIVVVVTGQKRTPAIRQLPLMALVGILDTGGNALYALAAQAGRLDTAAVLSSLYPGATVLLARFLLQERLTRQQWAGAFAALVAVVLIAA